MIMTQDEAGKWAKILEGFSKGKSYQIPFVYDNDGNVVKYVTITDFTVNPQCPTINLSYSRSLTMINPDSVSEVVEPAVTQRFSSEHPNESQIPQHGLENV